MAREKTFSILKTDEISVWNFSIQTEEIWNNIICVFYKKLVRTNLFGCIFLVTVEIKLMKMEMKMTAGTRPSFLQITSRLASLWMIGYTLRFWRKIQTCPWLHASIAAIPEAYSTCRDGKTPKLFVCRDVKMIKQALIVVPLIPQKELTGHLQLVFLGRF